MGKQAAGDRTRSEVLQRMLLDRQAEIKNRMRALRETYPGPSSAVKDEEEQSMQDFVLQMDVALVEMESETLRLINHALLRLAEGTYGICEECDENIAEARLRALPFAQLCRGCQEVAENEGQRPRHPHTGFEQDLSINARNDRAPVGAEREQAAIWNYASHALRRPEPANDEAAPAPAPRAARAAARRAVPARASRTRLRA